MSPNNDTWHALRAATSMLKAIGNEHRLLTLCALAERPLAVCDINRRVPIAQSALSQHLARLRSAGLVVAQRDGPKIRYALADARTHRLIDALRAEFRIPRSVPELPQVADWPAHVDSAATLAAPARL
jgi:DNA-binding transcriptional ArsR family regulator